MADAWESIDGREKLTTIFGRWPSFHDAEVLALGYERRPGEDPSVVLVVHLWQSTPETDERGYYKLIKHTRATFRFHECAEIDLDGGEFNGQNVILGVLLTHLEDPERGPGISVELEPCYGVHGRLWCRRAEVVEATPWAPDCEEGEFRYVESS